MPTHSKMDETRSSQSSMSSGVLVLLSISRLALLRVGMCVFGLVCTVLSSW